MVTLQEEATRLQFFETIFGKSQGWLEIATKAYNSTVFEQRYFRWPYQAKELLGYIDSKQAGHNVWFCTSLLARPQRNKGNITECTCLWADLDACHPDNLEHPKPNIIMESSGGRFQAIWCLDKPCPPALAEEYSRRIAYKYAEFGADIGTWNLGRLLRVPYTFNYKYAEPMVELLTCIDLKYPIELFESLPEIEGAKLSTKIPMPDTSTLPSVADILDTYKFDLPDYFYPLHEEEPADNADWSELFWKEVNILVEAGMILEEVFAVSLESACNKFKRDNRPIEYTWKDCCRAYAAHVQNAGNAVSGNWVFPTLVSKDDIPTDPSFIERYIEWATIQTDAPAAYHQLSAFIILSALLSKTVRIPTSIGTIRPNLWGMILADTTLTRKTTAMDMATELLDDVLEDTVVATDGSVEGLLSALSLRNGQSSMFKRDEFTGLVEQMVKKDYMSGMLEMFTQLYDGKNIKRVLKKETINVSHPVFLMFAGGIKEKMASVLTHEHISSGFIPRFLVVSAESNVGTVKPLGRRTEQSHVERRKLIDELVRYKARYVDDIVITTELGGQVMSAPEVDADLSDEAWSEYNRIEKRLLEAGVSAELKEYMTPIFDRMAKSMLKMAVLVAATRQVPEHGIIRVEKEDIYRATGFIQEWAHHTLELVSNLGISNQERIVQKVLRYVQNNEGCLRSDIMRSHRLSAQDMEALLRTLEMRGLIRTSKKGKGIQLWTR